MKCQFCHRPATVHLTDIISKKKSESHLCEECAREHQLIPDAEKALNVPALLQFLVSQSQELKIKAAANDEICPHCGLKYAQFRAQGRLGCPADYEVFRAALEPLLERIHRHTRHVGKTPNRHSARRSQTDRTELRRRIDEAVLAEHYEEAARLRDLIRSLGTAE